MQQPLWIDYSPVGSIFASLFLRLFGAEGLENAHIWVWVIHGLAALGFIAAVPLTYYAHVYRTPVSIYVRKPAPIGRLAKSKH